jgi:hypothetical protein
MTLEKGLRFKLLLLKRYNINFKRYWENRKIRKYWLNESDIDKVLAFISQNNFDKDRFYYIYWKKAEQLYELKKYSKAANYYLTAIDNVISSSYKKNKSKFKTSHYDLLLNNYKKAMQCLIKSERFEELDYYRELNMYSDTGEPRTNEEKGDYFRKNGQNDLAYKYYKKAFSKICSRSITRQYDYDPYVDGYLEDQYKEELKKQNEDLGRISKKINSL